MYTWEVLNRNQFESLFNLKVEKAQTRFLSDHWLTTGEIWTMLGLEKYGGFKREIPEKRPFEIC